MRDVFLPRSLEKLWTYLDESPGALVFAGGTDLLVKTFNGFPEGEALVCLDRIDELKEICQQGESIWIGACATHSGMVASRLVRNTLPALWKAVGEIGSPPVRNMGTIGGNICTASPAGDTLPPLYAMKAEVEILCREGARRLPIAQFIHGPGATGLQKAEIVSAVRIPKPQGLNLQHFEKVGLRSALACSVASLAALARLSPDRVVEEVSLAWGSVAPTVFTCPQAEETLVGRPLCAASLREAAEIVRHRVRPISDVRADAEYRRTVAGNLLLRLGTLS